MKKRRYTWKDIVSIKDKLYNEEHEITGEMDNDTTYKIDKFYEAVSKKHKVSIDEIKTYMMDNIDVESKDLTYGIEECGCYIDGIAEWKLDTDKLED